MEKHVRPASFPRSHVPCACEDDQQSLKELLDSSLDIICSIDEEGRFLTVSAASITLWGYSPEELHGVRYEELVVEEDHVLTEQAARRIMAGQKVTNFENRYRRKDGTIIPMVWSAKWNEQRRIMFCVARDAREKQLVERRLKRANQLTKVQAKRTEEILESMQDGFFGMDRQWRITYFNQMAERLTGKTKEEMLGKVFWQEFPTAVGGIAYHQYHRALNDNVQVSFEMHSSLYGAWFEVTAYPSASGLSVYFKNIDERKKAEIELKNSYERFTLACRATNDVIWDWDIKNNTVIRSEGFIRFGYAPEHLEGSAKTWKDIIHPKDRKRVRQSITEAINNRNLEHWEAEYRCKRTDGTYANVVDKGCIVRDEKGEAVRMVGAMKDVTEQKTQEASLRLANERFELVSKATTDVLWDWDIETNECYFSDQFTLLYGHENKRDSAYKNWIANIHPDDKKEVLQTVNNVMLDPTVSTFEAGYRFLKKDGTVAHVLDRGFVIRDKQGEAVRMVGSIQDVTRLKEKAEQLKQLSLVAKETVNAVVITDREERIMWVNQAFTDITEYSFEEALGQKPSQLLQGKNTSTRAKTYLLEQIGKGLPFECDIVNYSKSGKEYWIELKGQPILDEKGEVEQFFAIQTDITERIELQRLVVEKEIEAQRELTRAMIEAQEGERTEIGKELHDNVNQLLATIKLYIENIRNFPEHRDMFIDKGIDLAKKAMDESRNLSHRLVTPTLGNGSFRLAIEELLSHYQLLNLFTVDFAFTVCEDKLSPSFKTTIYRIIQECLTNVVKYAKATEVKVSILYEDQLVKVMIRDNGIGFDGLRTRGGIGFTNMRNRASLFKGKLQVVSCQGNGCAVNVLFPTINDQVIEVK